MTERVNSNMEEILWNIIESIKYHSERHLIYSYRFTIIDCDELLYILSWYIDHLLLRLHDYLISYSYEIQNDFALYIISLGKEKYDQLYKNPDLIREYYTDNRRSLKTKPGFIFDVIDEYVHNLYDDEW